MKWSVLILLILFSVSCSQDLEEISVVKASLECIISVGKTESSGGSSSYLKAENTPPDYIAGITLTVHNNEYSVSDVTVNKAFTNSYKPNKISINGLTIGDNTITAVAKSQGIAENNYYNKLTLPSGDINNRALNYSTQLRSKQKIYANYVSEKPVVVNVSSSTTNSADISMVTENHRLAVVVENPSNSDYDLMIELSKDINGVKTILETSSEEKVASPELLKAINNAFTHRTFSSVDQFLAVYGFSTMEDAVNYWYYPTVEDFMYAYGATPPAWIGGYVKKGEQHAIVINNTEAKGTVTYKIKVDYFKGENKIGSAEKEIIANAYDNITKLYYFNGTGLKEGTAIFKNISWEDMTDDNHSVTVK